MDSPRRIPALVALALPAPLLAGAVTTDGSLGQVRTLIGPRHELSAPLGQKRGQNLFHSLRTLQLDKGESLVFTGPADVANILTRVTGGSASNINGLIASEINGANVYLINPNGILFGPDAQLQISGAFVATTADRVSFSDGQTFEARNTTADPVLSSAPIGSFGFLGPTAAGITVRGSADNRAGLQVPENKGLSLIAGDVEMSYAALVAPSGHVNVTSVDSAGNAITADQDRPGQVTALQGFTKFGRASLLRRSRLDANGQTGGAIAVDSGPLSLLDSTITSVTIASTQSGGSLTINARGPVLFRNSSAQASSLFAGKSGDVSMTARSIEMQESVLGSLTFGVGDAGNVALTADEITVNGTADSGVLAASIGGAGNAGVITVRVKNLTVAGDAQLRAATIGGGAGGVVDIVAQGEVHIAGDGVGQLNGIISSTVPFPTDPTNLPGGDAGQVSITAKTLRLSGDGAIVVASTGQGNAGAVNINATDVIMDAARAETPATISAATSNTDVGGDAGVVTINADSLLVRNGATISAESLGSGDAGDVSIHATRSVQVRGNSFIRAATVGLGAAGNVAIDAGSGSLRLDSGAISTSTDGDAPAGDVTVVARSATLTNGSGVAATSNAGAGASGNVTMQISGSFSAEGDSAVATNSQAQGRAGDLTLQADTVRITGSSKLMAGAVGGGGAGDVNVTARLITIDAFGSNPDSTTSVSATTTGASNGGNVNLTGDNIQITNGAIVTAGTAGEGEGGNVSVVADSLLVSGSNGEDNPTILASATDGSGDGGVVDIRARSVRVANGALVTASTTDRGNGGSVTINADTLEVDGGGREEPATALVAGSVDDASGNGGTLFASARRIVVRRHGTVIAGTDGAGNGGDVRLLARESLKVTNNGTISAAADPTESDVPVPNPGDAGNVSITAPAVRIDGNSSVLALATRSNGGTVSISGDRIDLVGSRIAVQADRRGGSVALLATERIYAFQSQINAVGNTAIGSIFIDPQFTILNQSTLLTDTRPGGGGNINIVTEQLLQDDSTITAAGIITINVLNADTDVTAGLLELRGDFLDEAARLREACGRKIGEDFSSFIVEGRGGASIVPGSPLNANP